MKRALANGRVRAGVRFPACLIICVCREIDLVEGPDLLEVGEKLSERGEATPLAIEPEPDAPGREHLEG